MLFSSDGSQVCTLSVLEFLGLSLFGTLEVVGLLSEIFGDVEGMLNLIKLTLFLTTSITCSNFETLKYSCDKGRGVFPKSLATHTGICF